MTDIPLLPEATGANGPQPAPELTQNELTPIARARRPRPTRFRCVICNKEKPAREINQLDVVRPSLIDRIRADHPDLPAEGYICGEDLDRFRSRRSSRFNSR